ncbi:MAG TPA: glycosyltransferase family 4 protein [Polyangia bacterium]|jgi:glycosyltransferase involved in cell wall biosynthesis
MAVLVSHPHVAVVSANLAAFLETKGRLAAYFTGVAFAERGWLGRATSVLARRRPTVRNRLVAVRPDKLRTHPAVELAARLAARFGHGLDSHLEPYNAIFTSHDLAVSRSRWPAATDTVYAYEDGALLTFRRAARAGIARVWDLPTPHHRVAEMVFREEAGRWPDAAIGPPHREPEWKLRRKDGELALATRLAVASRFTRQSLDHLAQRAPVTVAPYGFPVDTFAPRNDAPRGPFTVLSVGSHDLRKGTPYLLEAWRRAAIRDAQLHLVGPVRLARTFLDRYAGLFTHTPHLPKSELALRYAAADLLVFPTLGDGFGLVIQEAMCCGTPVATTPCGGGPECITDGVDGWILPPRDIEALVHRLRACAADRDGTFRIGRAARARAERWTWREAGEAMMTALDP